MVVVTKEVHLRTEGEVQIIDITDIVNRALDESEIENGIVTVFVPGSTAAVTTIEYEPGLLNDLPAALERLFPKDIQYEHEKRWHDGNGHSHVRAAFLGPSLTIPFRNKRMMLGTWQQLVFVELDNKPRSRKIILQIIG
ncbi:MAG: secondary thiamine-phosphate synthase enzyme YjbQ [Canidatus Methanoxibalbensis ujae]|nr:secondary thiamine-phosphate synthase enzyme YjbQ [Candidatus Methanoxibalbensis ujae]MCW7078659.1 secondary thiamine-phosphate synthase enzyme YjbQ [Candidatus Methanoxibalbensis ujae]